MFTSQPIFCHATAQALDASTDASLLRGGNCNSHIPAFINTSDRLPMARACPQARDPLCFSLLEVTTGQLRVPGWLSQDTSWTVLSPWSGLSQPLVQTLSQSSLDFSLRVPVPAAPPPDPQLTPATSTPCHRQMCHQRTPQGDPPGHWRYQSRA